MLNPNREISKILFRFFSGNLKYSVAQRRNINQNVSTLLLNTQWAGLSFGAAWLRLVLDKYFCVKVVSHGLYEVFSDTSKDRVKFQQDNVVPCHKSQQHSNNGEGKKEFLLNDEPSMINMQPRVYRKHWFMLKLIFLMCKPIVIKGYELLETYDSKVLKYNYKIAMGDSEIINFGSGYIKREVVVHTSNLEFLFDTSTWSLDIKEESNQIIYFK